MVFHPCELLHVESSVGDNENVLEESKNCWDPLEPAYDRHGNRKNGEKKVIWSDNILKM